MGARLEVEVVNTGPVVAVFEVGGQQHHLEPGQHCMVPHGVTVALRPEVHDGMRVLKAAQPSTLERATGGFVVPVESTRGREYLTNNQRSDG